MISNESVTEKIPSIGYWEENVEQGLRFLAQPDHSYEIYYDADRTISAKASERGNLADNEGVFVLSPQQGNLNALYSEADIDEDAIADVLDNCVQLQNPDQLDVDQNGRGDACDDFDKDGRINSADNCPNLPNRTQSDEDGDGTGDVCDSEESRLTERYIWVPWAGMGIAVTVVIGLFALVAQNTRPKNEEVIPEESNDIPQE